MVGNNIIIQPVASHGTYIIIVLRCARVYITIIIIFIVAVGVVPATTNEIGTYLPTCAAILLYYYRNIICRQATEKSNNNIPKCLRMHREPQSVNSFLLSLFRGHHHLVSRCPSALQNYNIIILDCR